MRKVKFLQFFQGSETRNVAYEKDQVAEFPDDLAGQLVKDKRAEFVLPPPQPKPAPWPEPTPVPVFEADDPDEAFPIPEEPEEETAIQHKPRRKAGGKRR